MIPPEERRHVDHGPRVGERPFGAGVVHVVAKSQGNADRVLERARAVLRGAIDYQLGEWPSLDQWRGLLPGWFVEERSPERTRITEFLSNPIIERRSIEAAVRLRELGDQIGRAWSN